MTRRAGTITRGHQAVRTCPDCGKRCYRTRKDAKRAIRTVHPAERNTMTAYPSCDGSYWHIGHGYASRRTA